MAGRLVAHANLTAHGNVAGHLTAHVKCLRRYADVASARA
ncbi:hypothetical protein HMPREF3192_01145 [Atopobium deltae]|uniref:Uncharacterized protein n=1 Tax=Atopobium deltae TaxID=1393034 RepID=A0A133XSI7_9ACTN|nr:hypothetical protein HMPREF3192_01145 [Atopobium deltae]